MSGEGRSLTLESDVDDGVVLGLGIFANLHKLFCHKTILSVCVDAGLHKILVRYANPVLVVDAADECLSKVSVVEERLEWEIIFSLFDGCKSTLNDLRVLGCVVHPHHWAQRSVHLYVVSCCLF